MDFDESVMALSTRARKLLTHLKTEEATKQALVIPFLQVMGYDPFDPTEVIPEFIADFGTKKGEKVDYAIIRGGKPIIVIECKWSGINLETVHAAQLYRYFGVSGAKVGILTNGVIYRFFTDLEKTNQLDSRPFLEVNILEIQEDVIVELRKLSKSKFDIANLPMFAADLKYTREIKQHLAAQLIEPTEDFVKLFASQVYPGQLRQQVVAQFKVLTQKAFRQFLNDAINQRLQAAINNIDNNEVSMAEPVQQPETVSSNKGKEAKAQVATTPEEIEAFELIKQIASKITNPERIFMRDAVNYCAILLDNNNRKSVARLYFNSKKKSVEMYDKDDPDKVGIESISDINQMASRIIATIQKLS